MGEEIPQDPNKAAKALAKLGITLTRKPDESGAWQRDCFACDDLHHSAMYGEQEEADQACDSVYIADDAIMKMMST